MRRVRATQSVCSPVIRCPTTSRGRSIIKVGRPYQAEINRASSAMAMAQVTVGDDKLIYAAGSKLAPGALLPGVRGIAYQGMKPEILPGRNGAQYLDYVNSQIAELDKAAVVADEEQATGQVDAYSLLYRSAKQKQKYNPYTEKFTAWQVKLTEVSLTLARAYMPDDAVIVAVGSREQINIAEFRKTNPINHRIEVEESDDTIDTAFGRQLTFQHILQYVGTQLDKRTIGKIIKNSPFANFEDDFDDLTIDEDMAENDILALERGEQVQATKQADPSFMLKKIAKRKKEGDYKFLPQQVQQAYDNLEQQYEKIEADAAAALKAAQNEFIPVDGALVTCDFYVPPKDPAQQAKRAKIPYTSLQWLLDRLQQQGASADQLESMNAQNLSDIAQLMIAQKGQGAGNASPGMAPGARSAPLQAVR